MLKKILLQIPFFCIALIAIAQDTTNNKLPKTQIEKFNLKVGSILKREFISLYKYADKGIYSSGSLNVEVVKITDAASGDGLRGLLFTASPTGYSSRAHSGFIDENEIPNLIKFLDFLGTLAPNTPENYTEYNYNFQDLKGFAAYQPADKTPKWVYGLQTDAYYSESQIMLKIENIRDLDNKIKEYFKL